MKQALLFGILPLAFFFACADQTVDPEPTHTDAGAGSNLPATNCPSRCAAVSVTCGTDPGECTSLCLSITEGQLACIEDSDCGGGSCTVDAGYVVDAATEGGSTGECTPLSSPCLSAAECCGGGACTNKVGTSNMVCCASINATCADDQDCCTTHCGTAGKCCYGSTVACTAETASTCCSGVCDSTGLCAD